MYSWWWLRLSPETCREKPLRKIKTQFLHLVGLISLLPGILLWAPDCYLVNWQADCLTISWFSRNCCTGVAWRCVSSCEVGVVVSAWRWVSGIWLAVQDCGIDLKRWKQSPQSSSGCLHVNYTWSSTQHVYKVPPRTIKELVAGFQAAVTAILAHVLRCVQRNTMQCNVICLDMDGG